MTTTVHFCWLCNVQCSDDYQDKHYDEPGRIVFFCSDEHRIDYQELKNL